MKLAKYSMGIGDRFGLQGKAQLSAVMKAREAGVDITAVWNKSHREHTIIGTTPADVRREADQAVSDLNYTGAYYVDADHINLSNVDGFIEACDFFTIDVADAIGQKATDTEIDNFVAAHRKYIGSLEIKGLDRHLELTPELIVSTAENYLAAIQTAGEIYRHIENAKGRGNFITEISVDEAQAPQTPLELFFILSAVAREGIPIQTIAPKFSGRFNKGVEYVGDIAQFAREFTEDVAVIKKAISEFSLPENLKLSIHSGSDKFLLYEHINKAIRHFDTGVHIKTAGTTWLEELIGLALAGGDGLQLAKEVYNQAYERMDELCAPYSTVIDINKEHLPLPKTVAIWNGDSFSMALRHNPSCELYNPDFRQLLHVAYKIAAEMGDKYRQMVQKYASVVASNVTDNLFNRHIKPVFID